MPGDTRLPAGVCTLDLYSCAVPTTIRIEISLLTSREPPFGPRAAIMASQLCIFRDSVVSLASLHPCQQAARFLVHTRPPDHCGFYVSADQTEASALRTASYVTTTLCSPRALDWKAPTTCRCTAVAATVARPTRLWLVVTKDPKTQRMKSRQKSRKHPLLQQPALTAASPSAVAGRL